MAPSLHAARPVRIEWASAVAEPAREAPGFGGALRRAASGRWRHAPLPTAAAAGTPTPTSAHPERSAREAGAESRETPTGTAQASAARVVQAHDILRLACRAQIEIAPGPDMRFLLEQAAGGVELRARVSPALERVARGHLQAVSRALDGRGVRLARAEVHLARGRGARESGGR